MKRRALLTGACSCTIAYAARGLAAAVDNAPKSRPPDSRIPVTGKGSFRVELLDRVMLGYLEKIGCSAATLAVSRKGVLAHSRGYGWSDRNRQVWCRPETMIGIASCDKPITSAAIRQLARNFRLRLDVGLFELLRTEPRGPVIDARVHRITLRHLLEHKAGWQGEPLDRAVNAARSQGHKNPVPVETVLGFLMTQRLKDEPGARSEYCNFCFDTLRHVIERVSGLTAIDYFRRVLFQPFGLPEVRGFEAPGAPPRSGDPPLIWNADGGPVSASAPALCTFMRCFWLTGELRDSGNPLWLMNGSLPGSTAMMLWRPDATDVTFIFNGRGSVAHDEIRRDLEAALARTEG